MSTYELVRAFGNWALSNLAAGSIDQYARHHRRFLSAAGDIPLEDCKPHHLLSWAKKWHAIQAIQRLFNWARDFLEVIPKNPFGKIKLPPLGQRQRVLPPVNLTRLLRRAAPDFRRFLFCLRETLARPQEVRGFSWEQVEVPQLGEDLAAALVQGRAFFVLDKYKSQARRNDPRSKRIIPITPRLGRMLVRLAGAAAGRAGPVFRTVKGRAWSGNMVRLRFAGLRRRAGQGERDHRGERIVAYSLRHTMATIATAAGIKDRLLADVLGHTSTRTTARYQHLDAGHLTEAIARIAAAWKGKNRSRIAQGAFGRRQRELDPPQN